MADPSLIRFRAVVEGALAQLEARREEVNDLNVFPVADGDTGDNMALTLRAVLDELDRLSAQGDIDEIGRDELVDSVARAALLGARGNSGVILSQLIRGAAEELISRPGELVDPVLIGAAMARAADRAYGSVREPAEGTILTVVREMAHRVAREIAHMEAAAAARARPAGAAERADRDGARARARVGSGQRQARARTCSPVLRDAGVVDAGGYGLTIIFAGVIAALRGAEPPPLEHHAPARVTHPEHESSTYRFCTNFAVVGESLDASDWVRPLEELGDSVLVVGEGTTLKVHVHTDDPEAATRLFAAAGEVSHLDVADMHEQVAQRSDAARPARPALRRARGRDGRGHARAVRERRGVRARRRRDAEPVDLRAAGRHPRGARRGGRGAAELAERGDGRRARRRAVREGRARRRRRARCRPGWPPPSRSTRPAAAPTTPPRWATRSTHVRTGSVTGAARDDAAEATPRFRAGDAVGFVEEELVAWGDVGADARGGARRALAARPSWSR